MQKTVRVRQAEVEYYVNGTNSTHGVLLIHGTGGSAESTWKELTEALTPSYKVVSPNYSGSGNTLDGGARLELDDLVEQCTQVAMHEELHQFHVVGYSLGAVVAASMAAKHPDIVKSLTLIGGWIETDLAAAFQFQLWTTLLQRDRQLFAQLIVHTGFSPDFFQRYHSTEELNELASVMADNFSSGMERQTELDSSINIRSEVGSICAPSLVIGLLHDRLVPIKHARELVAAIHGAKYTAIAAGHLVRLENMSQLVCEATSFILANTD